MENTNKNTFEVLNSLNLSDKTKEKIGLKYLSWAYAWGELKKLYPDAERKIYRRLIETEETKTLTLSDGSVQTTKTFYHNEVPYFTDGRTCTVRVGVVINGTEYIEELPVMDIGFLGVMVLTVVQTPRFCGLLRSMYSFLLEL